MLDHASKWPFTFKLFLIKYKPKNVHYVLGAYPGPLLWLMVLAELSIDRSIDAAAEGGGIKIRDQRGQSNAI